VRSTPGRLPNWESGPQNHPKAKVAVSKVKGAAASMGGMVDREGAGENNITYSYLDILLAFRSDGNRVYKVNTLYKA
jgi:hypothetical protein